MQWIAIVVLSILSCVAFGVMHDQVTARICVEYYTTGHPQVIPSEDPTALELVWAVIATWWVGLILGVPLAIISTYGPKPKRTVGSLVRPITFLLLGAAMAATLAGVVGYIAAILGWVPLTGDLTNEVPQDNHIF